MINAVVVTSGERRNKLPFLLRLNLRIARRLPANPTFSAEHPFSYPRTGPKIDSAKCLFRKSRAGFLDGSSWCPALANSCAMANPMPLLPPVTSAS
jgi:hypothetical protein